MTAVPGESSTSLRQPLSMHFGVPANSLKVSLIYRGALGDSTSILLAEGPPGVSLGVVLWAPAKEPQAVATSMSKAREAAGMLSPAAASHVLLPDTQGFVEGRSYAVLPYCRSLSNSRPLWWLQRRTARRFVLRWLEDVCRSTSREVSSAGAELSFERPLSRLAACEAASPRVRESARRALARLADGKWQARHVLMHADLWKGNVLVRAPGDGPARHWGDRLCLIDWGGSEARGYAMFDLVRATGAFKIDSADAWRAVVRHCEILQCDAVDASSYLTAALAHIFSNLGQFPLDRFLLMADHCCSALDDLGAARKA